MSGRHHRREPNALTSVVGSQLPASGSAGDPIKPERDPIEQLAAYETAIDNLKAAMPLSESAQVIAVLAARDRIARLLDAGAEITAQSIARLAELDAFLRSASVEIEAAVGAKTLRTWKHSMDPESKRWWWALDEVAASARVKLHPGTAPAVAILLGISFAITGDTVGQLLKVAALSAGVVAVVTQAALTFFTGSALTESGRKSVLSALATVGLRARFRDWKVLVMAFAVLGLSILARVLVPVLGANFYVRRGDLEASREAWSQALDNYNRAVTLKPGDFDVHYKIAVAYDKTQQFDRAIEEYKSVVAADSKNSAALNNLARLYLLEKKEPYSALRLLGKLDQRLASLTPDGQYAVLKNRGWAKLELGLYEEADGDLAAALRVESQGIAAHYLRGRALEAQKRPEALREFAAVIQILKDEPDAESELEPDWILYAQRQLLQAGGAK